MSDVEVGPAIISGLYHDLLAKRSLVTLTWEKLPGKRLTLDVPFGCALSDLPGETERALRGFSVEIATMPIEQAR